MPEQSYPLWSSVGPDRALLASRDVESGEIVFPALPAASPLQGRHETVAAQTERIEDPRVAPSGPVCQRISVPQADIGAHSYGTQAAGSGARVPRGWCCCRSERSSAMADWLL